MKKYNLIIIVFAIVYSHRAMAQQDTNYTFYRQTMNFVNPAYAGEGGQTIAVINYRSQWSGIVGAPETQSAFFSTQTGNNVGLGVSVINDRTFIEQQTSVMLDFSYELKMSAGSSLYLGLKAGGNSYNANTEGLRTFAQVDDPSLYNLSGGFRFNCGIGALLKGNKYFISLSAPKILTPDRLHNDDNGVKLDHGKMHTYLAAGYSIELGGDLTFKPSALFRYISAAPISLDLTATLALNQIEFGASYRVKEGIGGMILWNPDTWLNLGYGYLAEYESAIANVGHGSHEVYLRFNL